MMSKLCKKTSMFVKAVVKSAVTLFILCFIINDNAFALYNGVDKSLMNSYIAEDESKNADIMNICKNFYYNYITESMTDFEKEMQIIRYLVETTEYDIDEANDESYYVTDAYRAYGALVNHKAVCSGYAKAFYILGKYCGLNVIIVTGTATMDNEKDNHAWNQIMLDDEWYNVDVTWEDPVSDKKYGYNNLRNSYINRTDFYMEKNHDRDNGYICSATKYNENVVSYYLLTGKVELNPDNALNEYRKELLKQMEVANEASNQQIIEDLIDRLISIGPIFIDNSNLFSKYNDEKINSFVVSNYKSKNKVVVIVTDTNSENQLSIDKKGWLEKHIEDNIDIEMKKIFVSYDKNDVRILIFKY